uniref:partner and localizer of BRCA2 n=1 Tax=Scatophagus argus TaxID=75038 RepID=UPI001ED83BB5|nr:partner and localizer of BRCA2 [Scatophagus argus]
MENSVGDILICEEQLRTTLHCDDKEKLRRKLLLLQREYIRTAQRLQRAERSEAVRRHVRSRITQQNHQDQRDPEVTPNPCLNPSSLTVDTTNGTTSGVPQCQGHTGDSENFTRSPVIRFTLPSDAACSQTTHPSQDAAKGHRTSPALRLRSRRSRLRWERRSAEAGRITDNTEEGQEQNERMNTAGTQGSEDGAKHEGTETVTESEGLFPSTEAESPSLLLTHWNTCGQTKTSTLEEKEIQGGQEQKEKATELRFEKIKESESTSLLQTCWKPAIHTKGKVQDGSQNGGRKEREVGEEDEDSIGQRDGSLCEDSSNKYTEQNKAEQIQSEKSYGNTAERKEEKSEMVGGEHDVKGASFLDSCTLVEGLLFPAEYYVRTTRRMASSQSLPDMQAVILSQLSNGRHRRSRGRGRGPDRHTQSHKGSDQHSQTDFSSLMTASPSVRPHMESQAADTSAELDDQSSDQISACQIDTNACFSPTVSAARSARGRRRRRGRGTRRLQTPQRSLSLVHQLALEQTSDDPQPTCSPISFSPSLSGADAPKPCLTPRETVPVPDDPPPASTQSTATQLSSGGNEAQPNSSPGCQVYPIFLRSCNRTNRSTQMNRSQASWRSLPSSSSPQTSLLPLPSLSLGPLVNNMVNFDIPQDFHLPDDQFASLKLHKLRQVAVESGAERFTSSSYNTRRSIRCYESHRSSRDALSLTPTVSDSANSTARSVLTGHKLTDKLRSQSLTEESCDRENPQQTENPQCQTQTASTGFVSVVQDCAADCADQCEAKDTADRPAGEVSDHFISQSDELHMKESYVISSEEHTDCAGAVHPLLIQMSPNHQTEDKAGVKTLPFDCTLEKTPEEPSDNGTAVHACNDSQVPGESPAQHLNVKSPAREISFEPTTRSPRENKNPDKCLPLHGVHSQLLLSPQASAPFITPHLCSSALHSSPTLPSLGLTPHTVPAGLLLTSSPSAPTLILPPPHSPSTQALPPPDLSPCPSLTSLPPSQPPVSPAVQTQASSEPSQRAEPATLLTVSGVQSQDSGGQVGLRTEEAVEAHMMRCTYRLKGPAGGCLVDACCLPGSSGGLCVAAAGKWAVCLWNQVSASDWNLIHTWSFDEPVINVFPVLDAAGLMCVTLGQLEIREVRMLSSSSLLQVLLCEGLVQTVICVTKSRVVTSSHSASGSTLQVFTLSDRGSTLSSQPLVSPGVCVGALAQVEGLPDALIGTDEEGRLFIWNLETGQLLRRIILGDALSHTACLRGYSDCGVLFVLLQHQLIISLEDEDREPTGKDQMFLEEKKRDGETETALLSFVAVNPLSGKSVVATRLYPPKAWSGRLCEADVNSCSVVGLSQSGCVCVWELGRRDSSRMVWAPESEGWQLARWGAEGGTLVTGHHNGDVTLHCYSTSQPSLCR